MPGLEIRVPRSYCGFVKTYPVVFFGARWPGAPRRDSDPRRHESWNGPRDMMTSAARTFDAPEAESSGHCIWCNRQLGEGSESESSAYRSDACRVEAIRKLLRRERFKAMRHEKVRREEERKRLEAEAALLRSLGNACVVAESSVTKCPRCDGNWHVHGGSSRSTGACGCCGFRTTFVAIEECPHCEEQSLVVESADDAKCPRCKNHPRRVRQVA